MDIYYYGQNTVVHIHNIIMIWDCFWDVLLLLFFLKENEQWTSDMALTQCLLYADFPANINGYVWDSHAQSNETYCLWCRGQKCSYFVKIAEMMLIQIF